MRRRFSGFVPETLQFFQDIRFHNDKMWFDAHRDDFEAYVKTPMEALCMDLEPVITRIDPSLDVRPRRAVSRIYRDARYARGIPYRDHMWLSFKPVGKSNSEAFTYYFYIQEDAWGVGIGLYTMVPEILDPFRQRLRTESDRWRKILDLPAVRKFTVETDSPKRPRTVGLAPDIEPWYHYRRFSFDRSEPAGPCLFSPELTDLVAQAYSDLEPVYRFVCGMNMKAEDKEIGL